MPGRSDFPDEYFDGNPLEGLDPIEAYKTIQWGNEPEEVIPFNAPENLVSLGQAAMVRLADGTELHWSEGEAHLAIGAETNRIYIFPVGSESFPPDEEFSAFGEAEQTDYYSDKGGEPGYYYHEHEEPNPVVLLHPEGCLLIEPLHDSEGRRSYAVGPEGIIG